MLLLAIDTSTSAIAAALHDGQAVLVEEATVDARAHAEHLAPGIERALAAVGAAPAEVSEVVVGVGPGPFTGLRVGMVTGMTFAHALGVPVHGLCSLDALAHAAWLGGARAGLLVATDARRKEVYAAHYLLDDSRATRVAGPVVGKAVDLPEDWRTLPTVGRGALLYPDALSRPLPLPHPFEVIGGHRRPANTSNGGLLDVPAGALADLAVRRLRAGEVFDGLEPLYLRRPDVAPPPVSRKSTLG